MTYSWQQDFGASYDLALRILALRHGSRLASNFFEWYFVESEGGIP